MNNSYEDRCISNVISIMNLTNKIKSDIEDIYKIAINNETIIWIKYGIEKLKKGINGINNIIEYNLLNLNNIYVNQVKLLYALMHYTYLKLFQQCQMMIH